MDYSVSFFVLFRLVIVLFILQLTNSDYIFGIFTFIFTWNDIFAEVLLYLFIYPWITTTRTTLLTWHVIGYNWSHSGADRGFQVRGAHLKNCAERREARKFLGYFVWKITILRKQIIFFPILGGRAPGAPPRWIRPWHCIMLFWNYTPLFYKTIPAIVINRAVVMVIK